MNVYREEVKIKTSKRVEIIDITDEIKKVVSSCNARDGIVHLWVPHTTATITVNERDPDLWIDILEAFERVAPLSGDYRHNRRYAGIPSEQNAHAHIISSFLKPDIVVPLERGKLTLGTWQSILFVELDGPRSRRVIVRVYW